MRGSFDLRSKMKSKVGRRRDSETIKLAANHHRSTEQQEEKSGDLRDWLKELRDEKTSKWLTREESTLPT